jgi:hypothetical protein
MMYKGQQLFDEYFNAITIKPKSGAGRWGCYQAAKALAGCGQFGTTDVYLEFNGARIPIKLGEHIVEYTDIELTDLIQKYYKEEKAKTFIDPLWNFAFNQSIEQHHQEGESVKTLHFSIECIET